MTRTEVRWLWTFQPPKHLPFILAPAGGGSSDGDSPHQVPCADTLCWLLCSFQVLKGCEKQVSRMN